MAARTGEQARESGDFRCERCNNIVRVNKGNPIPRCPSCGNETFEMRRGSQGGGRGGGGR